mmetsp:Transcript_11110/g.24506  ORF Transcript_11110/g.24506 Transcript_11110/m.24506 type:complete len:208 (-) Transcript_11110:925-1548(-)
MESRRGGAGGNGEARSGCGHRDSRGCCGCLQDWGSLGDQLAVSGKCEGLESDAEHHLLQCFDWVLWRGREVAADLGVDICHGAGAQVDTDLLHDVDQHECIGEEFSLDALLGLVSFVAPQSPALGVCGVSLHHGVRQRPTMANSSAAPRVLETRHGEDGLGRLQRSPSSLRSRRLVVRCLGRPGNIAKPKAKTQRGHLEQLHQLYRG